MTDIKNKDPLINLVSPLPKITNVYPSLATISNITNDLTKISDVYKTAYKNIEDMQANAVKPLLSAIENIQAIAGTAVWKDIASISMGSPIVNAVKDIEEINTQLISRVQPRNLLPIHVVKNIKNITNNKTDKVYNYSAYIFLYKLEIYLRTFINVHIIKPNIKQLASKIPQEILDSWVKKKSEEETNQHIDKLNYELIDYSDFTELKTILEKRTTIPLIKDIISEANIKTITSKLFELEPIRNKVAHSRSLTKNEFNTLKLYCDKINKILPF